MDIINFYYLSFYVKLYIQQMLYSIDVMNSAAVSVEATLDGENQLDQEVKEAMKLLLKL